MEEVQKQQIFGTFEQACLDFVNPATQKEAEKVLLEFRKLPGVIPLCRYILERSSAGVVQFHAISTLRDTIIRDWSTIQETDKAAIRAFLFEFVMGHPNLESYVAKLALQTLAMIIKRGYLEGNPDEQVQFRNSMFQPLWATIQNTNLQSPQDLKIKEIAINLLSAIVDEFTYTKSNSIGLTWEYHHKCLQQFQKGELLKIYSIAIAFVGSIISNDKHVLLKSTLGLLSQVLTWKFEEPDIQKFSISFRSADPITTTRPGPDWRILLVDGDSLEIFFKIYTLVKEQEELCHLVLTCITQLASINGNIFPDEKTRVSYVAKVLQGLLAVMGVGCSGTTQILGIAQIVLRITGNFKLSSLLLLPDLVGVFIQQFTEFTCKCLKLLQNQGVDSVLEDVESCFDTLLEAWLLLITDNGNQASKVHTFLKDYTSRIFQLYVTTRLVMCKFDLEADEEEEDVLHYKDQLTQVSFLGRIDAGNCLGGLNKAIQERTNILQQALLGAIQGSQESILEEIHWLLLISGHLIADSPEGEIPVVPEEINSLSKECPQQEDPLLVLVRSVFVLVELENQYLEKGSSLWSPLVGETLMWFINRWASTYLIVDSPSISPNILKAYGSPQQGGEGVQILEFVFRKVAINFDKWYTEPKLVKQTARLFLTLAQLKNFGLYLMQSNHWMQLIKAHCAAHPSLDKLPAEVQRDFMQALVNFSEIISEEPQQRRQYLLEIINVVKASLSSLTHQGDFTKVSQNPAVILKLSGIIEKFRGISRGLISDDVTIYETCSQYFDTFVGLIDVYKNFPEVVILILKFYGDFAQYQTENLSPTQAGAFYNSVINLFKRYSAHNLGRISTIAAQSLAKENEKEAYRDILAMLKLLCTLGSQSQDYEQVQDVIFLGISIVLPLITTQLLQFPKLCNAYYNLMNCMFDQCPHKVALLPPDLFKNLIVSLEFGVNNHDAEIARKSLEALGSMARFNFLAIAETGVSGLHQQQIANGNLMFDILKFLLNFLLFSDFSGDLLEAASDALFCVICSEQNTYRGMVEQLIQQMNLGLRERLIVGFNNLTNNVSLNPDRNNLERFRNNMQLLLANIKSFLLTK